ncbi:radical SAM protein [Catenulispora subtropica]|uniref:Radical SAM core domain-containing protein n=1 Tax=Catenulispora subtropica TaxID=450798 RepID=A0ABP5E5T5_9ACTN
MSQLIAAPFLGGHFIVKPGAKGGVRLPSAVFAELASAEECPPYLLQPIRDAFGEELAGVALRQALLVRQPSSLPDGGFSRASWEINLGCNWACEHCYLGLKRFEGLAWDDKARLLETLRDAGVLYLQITGGEPTIDPDFVNAYSYAADLGMVLHISSNASQLHRTHILEAFERNPPWRITVSIYGASENAYDKLVRRRGAWRLFMRGMAAALEADLPLRLNIVLTKSNASEREAMIGLAEEWGLEHIVYGNLSPTIYGTSEVLDAQDAATLTPREPFGGCNAGHTFFHVDPHGMATVCKIERDVKIDLISEGLAGLERLGQIAAAAHIRTGGCSGCALSGSCTVCRPLAKLYQTAKAPLNTYCQHGRRNPE